MWHSLRYCLQVIWPSLKHYLILGCQKRHRPINLNISADQAVQFEWSLVPSLFTYSHTYLSFKAISWPMMHCGRHLLTSGIRLLCGREERFLCAARHVVKSSLPDVEIPSTVVSDYVWQRVDQWPDKVAIVSMDRASSSGLSVTPGSRRLV